MTRIQQGAADQEILEKQLSKLDARLKSGGNRVFSCFNCLLYLVAIFLVAGWFIGVWLAKSGLAEVPYLSQRYYSLPKPAYTVAPLSVLSANDFITKLLASSAQNYLNKTGEESGPKDISISEGQLTGLLQHALNAKDNAQISLHDELMDLYIQTSPRVVFQLKTKPVVKNGNIRFETVDFKIGQAGLPNFLASLISGLALDSGITTLQKTLGGVGEVQAVKILPGELIISVK